jgi:hypothetical protein
MFLYIAFDSPEPLLRVEEGVCMPSLGHGTAAEYRLVFPSQSLTAENILSIGFVEVRIFLNSAGTLR